ncbi:MAG: glycosyltransferase family 2 protein [bacterium]
MSPILSICIPTYNRAKYLDKILESLVIQNAFLTTDEIEIVISDNCSEDETQAVVKKYVDLFADKIKYHRNEVNMGADKNYENILALANGTFLKLQNDTLLTKNGSLAELVKIVKANINEKPVIFFLNGQNNHQELMKLCNNLTEFVSYASFYSTWIGGFGLWKEDFNNLTEFSRKHELRLVQTDVILRLIASGKKAAVYNPAYFLSMTVPNKGGYNIAEVFGQNYLSLYKEYLDSGLLNKTIYENEKQLILLKHIIPYYFDFNNQYNFEKTGFFKYMKDYKHDWYFYEAMEYLISHYSSSKIDLGGLNHLYERK